VVDHRLERGADESFGQRLSLCEQRPGPEAEREAIVGTSPCGVDRHDVENRQALDALRMVERRAVGDAASPVVARNREPVEAEPRHDAHHVARERSLRVGRVVRGGWRTPAAAVAPQVRAHHGEPFGEQRRHVAPHGERLGKAVQQQHRRTRPAPLDVDRSLAHLDHR